MSPTDEKLLSVAREVADRIPVDWDRAASDSSAELRAALDELRVLDRIAALHERSPAVATDAPTLEGRSPRAPRRSPRPPPETWAGLEVIEPIGRGGFGDVFRAWDPALEREVALKLVPVSEHQSAAAVLAEGRRLARVRHPNVMAVYGAEQVGDRVGIWGELIRGRTLAEIVGEDGPMGAQEAALVGVTLCQALAAVHAAGLLHRDVKAQNVIREQGGRIVLVDLGSGRPQRVESPLDHDLRGTPLYMAPELFAGKEASPGTDRYSLGILLYYLVSGRFPFPGRDSAEIAESFARRRRDSLRDVRPDLPETFVRAVERAIAPDPGARQASDGELESELARSFGLEPHTPRHLGEPDPLVEDARPRRAPRRRTRLVMASAFVVAILTVLAIGDRLGDPAPADTAARAPSLALTPIRGLSDDPEVAHFAAGLTSVLESNLGSIPGLQVLSPAADHGGDPGASHHLSGALQRSGSELRATLRLSETSAGDVVWSREIAGTTARPFALQAQILDELVRGMLAQGVVDEPQIVSMRERLDASPTEDAAAFDAYARGVSLLERANEPGLLERAIAAFEEAVERDPRFALAHAELGRASWEVYERTFDPAASSRATRHGLRAQELAPQVPRVRLSLATIYHGTGSSQAAITELEKVLALQPASDAAHRLLGQIHGDLGDAPAAEAAFRRAIALRPDSTANHAALGYHFFRQQDYEKAIESFRLEVALQPTNAAALQRLATSHHALGELDQAEIHYRRSIELAATPGALTNLGTVHYAKGEHRQAADAYARAAELSPNDPQLRRNLGDAHRALGDEQAAASAYRSAVELARQALEIDPSDAHTLALQGLCEAKLGRTAEALELLERAERARPGDALVLYQRAAVLALAARPTDAIETLRLALDAGYTRALLSGDQDFTALRGTPAFEALLAR